MTTIVLITALLVGSPFQSRANLELRIHVGQGRESDIIRAELKREQVWYLSQRLAIERNYRITIIEDQYRARPAYQIGKADPRHEFPAGTFSGSGCFIVALRSIAERDQWDRENPWLAGGIWADTDQMAEWQRRDYREQMSKRPLPFPPPRIEVEYWRLRVISLCPIIP